MGRLNERAAISESSPSADGLLPIWHVDEARALFAGPLGRNDPHAHSVPVLVTGLYGAFRLKIGAGHWMRTPAAVIPAGTSYEFDVEGQPLAVLYLEPDGGGCDLLAAFLGETSEARGALIGACSIHRELRALYEARDGVAWASAALDDIIAFAAPRARRRMDERIAQAVASLSTAPDTARSAVEAAHGVGLSSSRFQHLFAEEVGVPFRRFRGWQRLRRAIAETARGASLTAAAHTAGFADQAHFARQFRQTFGAPASPSLRKVRCSQPD